MRENSESSVACHHRVGFLGLLITLGIVFGDIGTSPLYVMKAILHTGEAINESTIWVHCRASSGHSPCRPPSNTYVWRCVPTTMAKEAFSPSTPCCAR